MNERLTSFLRHRATLPTVTAVVGFAAGAVAGYMRTKSQYDDIENSLAYVNSQTDQIELDFEHVEVLGELSKAAGQLSLVAKELKSAGEDMLEALGILAGTTMRQIEVQQDEQAAEVLREDHSSPQSKRRPLQSVRKITEARIDSVALTPNDETEHGGGRITAVEFDGVVVKNIFDDSDNDEWDYKTELESRTDDAPYIIHVDEFVAGESGWGSNSTLTWYEGDNILCDSTDKPIYNAQETVGELRFGHGSKDPNIVYVRNPKLQTEYEILRDEGSYQEIVLGEQIEAEGRSADLKHSHQRRFRDD